MEESRKLIHPKEKNVQKAAVPVPKPVFNTDEKIKPVVRKEPNDMLRKQIARKAGVMQKNQKPWLAVKIDGRSMEFY
jgi:hypothetical protein